MGLLKKLFGWDTGQSALMWGNKKQIAPQFTSEPSEEEGPPLEVIDECLRAGDEGNEASVEPDPVKTEVRLGGKTYIVEELTARDIKKLQQNWGKGKLKSLGIIK